MVTKRNTDGTTIITRSVSETGHTKNAASFSDMLKGLTDLGTKYQPANESIQLWTLGIKNEQVTIAMDNWGTAIRESANAENERTKLFATLNSYSTRILNTLISSANISALTIKDARSIVSKIQGSRSVTGKKAIAEAKNAGVEPARTISVSQLSYDQKCAHFAALRKLIATQPTYNPNEADLKLTAIEAYEGKLKKANNNMIAARSKLIDARNQRNLHLYDDQTGVIALSKAVKSYVKGIFGATHVDYQKIKGIPFKVIRDKASSLK